MSTAQNEPTLETALSSLPASLRSRLLSRYRDLKAAYVNGQYDACGLRTGRLCEVLIRVLQNELTGGHTPFGTKLDAFDRECLRLEKLPKSAGAEGMRVIMPRALNFLYTLRNKRGIGHEGGDVDANQIDAATAVRVSDWCIAELIRVVRCLAARYGLDRQRPADGPDGARLGVEEASVAAARLLTVRGGGDRHRLEPVELAERRSVVSSVARAASGAAGRFFARPRERHDDYVLCPEDGFWFRPPYTGGTCPLCGKVAPGGAPPLPRLLRIDRFSLVMAALTLVALGMSALVLFTYLEG